MQEDLRIKKRRIIIGIVGLLIFGSIVKGVYDYKDIDTPVTEAPQQETNLSVQKNEEVSDEDMLDAAKVILGVAFKDNADIKVDKENKIIRIIPKRTFRKLVTELIVTEGSESKPLEAWDIMVNSIKDLSNSIDENGLDYSLVVSSPVNDEDAVLFVKYGATIYDVVNDFPTKTKTSYKPGVSDEFRYALEKAESYAQNMHMSKKAIYDHLISEYGGNFTEEEAQYAIDNLDWDYKENALEQAKSYSQTQQLSKKVIYDQLVSEITGKFTEEEAQYAVSKLGQEFKENALKNAKYDAQMMNMSKKAIYESLTSKYGGKFSDEEAQYAIDNLDWDYKENAYKTAKIYFDELSMSKKEVYKQLTSEYGGQFTEEEAQYAINKLYSEQ